MASGNLNVRITYTIKGTMDSADISPKGIKPIIATVNGTEIVFVKARVDTGKILYVAKGDEYTVVHNKFNDVVIVWKGDDDTPIGRFHSEMKFPYSNVVPFEDTEDDTEDTKDKNEVIEPPAILQG